MLLKVDVMIGEMEIDLAEVLFGPAALAKLLDTNVQEEENEAENHGHGRIRYK